MNIKLDKEWVVSYIKIYIITFIVMLVFNQFKYGNCYEMYCLSAAFNKLWIFAAVVSLGIKIFFFNKPSDGDK